MPTTCFFWRPSSRFSSFLLVPQLFSPRYCFLLQLLKLYFRSQSSSVWPLSHTSCSRIADGHWQMQGEPKTWGPWSAAFCRTSLDTKGYFSSSCSEERNTHALMTSNSCFFCFHFHFGRDTKEPEKRRSLTRLGVYLRARGNVLKSGARCIMSEPATGSPAWPSIWLDAIWFLTLSKILS